MVTIFRQDSIRLLLPILAAAALLAQMPGVVQVRLEVYASEITEHTLGMWINRVTKSVANKLPGSAYG